MKPLLFIAALLLAVVSNAQTPISGGIYTNTTWTKAGSPYILTGQVVVYENTTLTIEPGVKVLANYQSQLEIRGKLTAIGTKTDSIYFAPVLFNSWEGIKANGTGIANSGPQITLDYCYCALASTFADLYDASGNGTYNFKHCYFRWNDKVSKRATTSFAGFDSCYFELNGQGPEQGAVSNCFFAYNQIAVLRSMVNNSTFVSNDIAAEYTDSVGHCIFRNNRIAIEANFSRLSYNEIVNNRIGIILHHYSTTGNYLRYNKVCGNDMNISYVGVDNGDISHNCWCLTDSASIRAKIWDGYTNPVNGLLKVSPFDTCSLTAPAACDTPKNVHINYDSSGMTISWDAVAGALGYEYWIDSIPVYGSYTTGNYVSLASYAPGTVFSVHVRTRCTFTDYSPWASTIDTVPVVGVKVLHTNNTLKLYPNPATGILNIETNASNTNLAFTIIDLMGKTVLTSTLTASKQTIDVSQWPAGMYFVKCEGGNGMQVVKFLKE